MGGAQKHRLLREEVREHPEALLESVRAQSPWDRRARFRVGEELSFVVGTVVLTGVISAIGVFVGWVLVSRLSEVDAWQVWTIRGLFLMVWISILVSLKRLFAMVQSIRKEREFVGKPSTYLLNVRNPGQDLFERRALMEILARSLPFVDDEAIACLRDESNDKVSRARLMVPLLEFVLECDERLSVLTFEARWEEGSLTEVWSLQDGVGVWRGPGGGLENNPAQGFAQRAFRAVQGVSVPDAILLQTLWRFPDEKIAKEDVEPWQSDLISVYEAPSLPRKSNTYKSTVVYCWLLGALLGGWVLLAAATSYASLLGADGGHGFSGMMFGVVVAVFVSSGLGMFSRELTRKSERIFRGLRPLLLEPQEKSVLRYDGGYLWAKEAQIDLEKRFFVRLHRSVSVGGVRLLVVSIGQDKGLVCFQVPVHARDSLEHLEKLESDAPVLSQHDFLERLWPLLVFRAEVLGVRLPSLVSSCSGTEPEPEPAKSLKQMVQQKAAALVFRHD